MRIKVVKLKSPWEILADDGVFSQGERFRETNPTKPAKKRDPDALKSGRGVK